MALNKYATIRYRVIDRCIRSIRHPFPSKEFLRQACEEELYGSYDGSHISISTIEKDLATLKNESTFGYAPIAYSKLKNGYFYTDPDYSLDLPLSETDIELIHLATKTLNHFKDSQIFKDLENSIEKIRGRLSLVGKVNKEEEQVIQFEAPIFTSGSEYLPELLDAIKQNSKLRLEYQPFADDQIRSYQYHPYLLKEHKNRWYLIGFDEDTATFRTLGLDRIKAISVSQEEFIKNLEFNPDEYYRYSFGIGIYSGKPEQVILHFEPVQSKYIIAQPIHATQEIIEEDSTGILVRIKVIPSPELFMHIASYGDKVKLMDPTWMREEMIRIHKGALENYRKS